MIRPHLLVPFAASLMVLACSESVEPASVEPPALAPREPFDVILVTWDTVRWDHVGTPADDAETVTPGLSPTPTWDRYAREGVVFTEARTTAPVTLPAHTSILTGLQPSRHGVRDNGLYRLQESVSTLAEEFARAGYLNAAFVSAEVLHSRHGLDRGFEHYDFFVPPKDEKELGVPHRRGDSTTDSAISWLAHVPADRPLFLWLHLYDPHRNWEALAPYSDMHDPYRAEIAFADAQTGRLLNYLAGLGRLSRSLVLITSDHGESLDEHGEKSHVYFAYDSTMRVPLLFWAGPETGIALTPGTRVDGIASHVDLAPTLRTLARLPEQPTDGLSLVPQLTGEPLPERWLSFEAVSPALGFGAAPIFGVVASTGEVWLDSPRRERFDLRSDPGQLRNLYSADDDPAADSLFARFPRDWPPGSDSSFDLDPVARERLAALGYTLGDASSTVIDSTVDAKDRLEIFQLIARDVAARKPHRLIEDYAAMRAKHGPIPQAVLKEVFFLKSVGRLGDARELLHEAVLHNPHRPDLEKALDDLTNQMEDDREHISRIRMALEADPEKNAKHRSDLAALLYQVQEHAEAEMLYREIIAEDPDNYEAVINFARMLNFLERDEEALSFIRRLRSRPDRPVLYDCLAGDLLLNMRGNREEGEEAIRDCAARGGEISEFRAAVLDGTWEGLSWD